MTYQREFPTMTAMPAIPSDWTDKSWHNDVCPSFLVAGDAWGDTGTRVWVDYEKPEEREHGGPRFVMDRTAVDATPSGPFLETDDWNEILRHAEVEKLAWTFAVRLMRELSPAEWRNMRIGNRSVGAGVCASHDYRDTNEIMAEAWAAVIPRPLFGADGHISDESTAVWNAAWNVAKPNWLTSDDMGDKFDAWRCTRHHLPDLATVEDEASGPGYSYLNPNGDYCGHIEEYGAQHIVNVGNRSETFDYLADAERYLWHNHAASIVCQPAVHEAAKAVIRDSMVADSFTVSGHLTDVLTVWCESQGLPAMSADDLLHEALTPDQRRFVSAFYLLWEANQAD